MVIDPKALRQSPTKKSTKSTSIKTPIKLPLHSPSKHAFASPTSSTANHPENVEGGCEIQRGPGLTSKKEVLMKLLKSSLPTHSTERSTQITESAATNSGRETTRTVPTSIATTNSKNDGLQKEVESNEDNKCKTCNRNCCWNSWCEEKRYNRDATKNDATAMQSQWSKNTKLVINLVVVSIWYFCFSLMLNRQPTFNLSIFILKVNSAMYFWPLKRIQNSCSHWKCYTKIRFLVSSNLYKQSRHNMGWTM